jgi:hypothetical protein
VMSSGCERRCAPVSAGAARGGEATLSPRRRWAESS